MSVHKLDTVPLAVTQSVHKLDTVPLAVTQNRSS